MYIYLSNMVATTRKISGKLLARNPYLRKLFYANQFGDWRAQSLIMGTSYKDAQLQFKEGTSVL